MGLVRITRFVNSIEDGCTLLYKKRCIAGTFNLTNGALCQPCCPQEMTPGGAYGHISQLPLQGALYNRIM